MPRGQTFLERLGDRVLVGDDCWQWTGHIDALGYGTFFHDGRMKKAHRVVYELLVGPIEEGKELDHLCRRRGCVRPSHLEPVTHVENVRRGDSGNMHSEKTHCPRGHEYNEANTRQRPGRGGRDCKLCANIRRRKNLA